MRNQDSESHSENGSIVLRGNPKAHDRTALKAWLERSFLMSDEMARARSIRFAPAALGFKEYQIAKRYAAAAEILRENAQPEVARIVLLREGLSFALEAYRTQGRLAIHADRKAILSAAISGVQGSSLGDELSSSERFEIERSITGEEWDHGIPSGKGDRRVLIGALTNLLECLLGQLERRETAIQRVWVKRLVRWLAATSLVVGLLCCAYSCMPKRNERSLPKSSEIGNSHIGLVGDPTCRSFRVVSRYS